MRHFDTAHWADFARGLVSDEDRVAMRGHLDAGCGRCDGLLETCRRLLGVAAADAAQPPLAVVQRSAKAIFDLSRPERRSLLDILPLELKLDSALAPVVAGVREGVPAVRQLLYESEQFTLDVQVESLPESRGSIVTGQLLTPPRGAGLGRVPACLVADDRVAASGLTSKLGEFELAADLGASPELWLLLNDDRSISVSLA